MEIIFQPTRDGLGEYPPIPAKKIIPQWYKDLPTEIHKSTAQEMFKTGDSTPFSIKRCVPVLDFLTSGYVIRNQSEILLSCDDDFQQHVWWYTNMPKETPIVAFHPHQQCPINIKNSRKSYFKLSMGYRVITPPGYSCLFYQSPYFMEDRFTLFPGIVDTDSYDNEVLFPGFIHEKKTNFMIELGTPLMWVFPFKRDNWDSSIKSELHNQAESTFTKKSINYIYDLYKRLCHQRKNYE